LDYTLLNDLRIDTGSAQLAKLQGGRQVKLFDWGRANGGNTSPRPCLPDHVILTCSNAPSSVPDQEVEAATSKH
jgi:hypothetical protein